MLSLKHKLIFLQTLGFFINPEIFLKQPVDHYSLIKVDADGEFSPVQNHCMLILHNLTISQPTLRLFVVKILLQK